MEKSDALQGGSRPVFLLPDHWALLLQRYHRYLASERRLSPHTVAAYGQEAFYFLDFLNHYAPEISLKGLAVFDLTGFRSFLTERRQQKSPQSKSLSNRSMARALSALRQFFAYLSKVERIDNEAIHMLDAPRLPHHLPRPLERKNAEILPDMMSSRDKKAWVNARDRAIFLLLYGTGLRISEALGLDENILPLGESLRVLGKGRKERILPLLPLIARAVEAYRAQCPYALPASSLAQTDDRRPLFYGVRGGRLNPREIQRALEAIRTTLGLDKNATPHALRHSFASHLLNAGADLRSLQELMGHANITSTQIYTQLDTNRLEDIYKNSFRRA